MNIFNLFGATAQEIINKQVPIFIVCIVVGFLSFALLQTIAISQLLQVWKTKNTSSVSIWTYIIFLLGGLISLAWSFCFYLKIIYGNGVEGCIGVSPDASMTTEAFRNTLVPLGQWGVIPLIAYNTADILLAISLTTIKYRHMKICQRLKISELELANKLLSKDEKVLASVGAKSSKVSYWKLILLLTGVYILVIVVSLIIFFFMVPKANGTNLIDMSGSFWWDDGIMVVSVISAFANEAMGWPTFIGTLRKRDTSGISMNWAIFVPLTMTMQFFYGLLLAISEIAAGGLSAFPPDTIGALIFNGLIVNYGVLILKVKNVRMAKRLKMSEIKYTETVLIPEYQRKVEARKEVLKRINEQQVKVNEQKTLLSKLKTSNEKVEKFQQQRVNVEQNKLNKIKSKSKETQNKLIKESEKADKKHGKR